jgi:pimeloyl-ACP methyl ester carboxylesterase
MKKFFLTAVICFITIVSFAQSANNGNETVNKTAAKEEPVTLETASGNIYGKLLVPDIKTKCPVVLIIAGSGPTDMDGNTPMIQGKNNSLKYLAEGLASDGIASLRFDKRGIASSAKAAKSESDLRFEDYVNDAAGWVEFLKKDKRFSSVSVAGHSEGSLIGMIACAKVSGVKGFISIAGAGYPAYDMIESQLASQPDAVQQEVARIDDSLKVGKIVKDVPSYLNSLYRESVQPYMISWYKYDPRSVIKTLTVPILILQGDADIQVTTEDAKVLQAANPSAKMLIIKGMNHVFKHCDSMDMQQQVAVYGDPSLPINSELLTEICSFVKR